MICTYALPYPPTVNLYYRSLGRGRVVISAAGRTYRKTVWALLREAGAVKHLGRLFVTIAATMSDRRIRDLDNLHKGLLDAMRYGGVYEDDSQIDDLRIYRAGIEKPGAVVVTVGPLVDCDIPRVDIV